MYFFLQKNVSLPHNVAEDAWQKKLAHFPFLQRLVSMKLL